MQFKAGQAINQLNPYNTGTAVAIGWSKGSLDAFDWTPVFPQVALPAELREGMAAMDEFGNKGIGRDDTVSPTFLSVSEERAWSVLRKSLGDDQLARLLKISKSSVRCYAHSECRAPGAVISKVRWLTLEVGHFNGTYNEFGVRRWFERPRTLLEGRSPLETLLAEGNWAPDEQTAKRVEELARASMGMTAT